MRIKIDIDGDIAKHPKIYSTTEDTEHTEWIKYLCVLSG